MSEHTAEPAAVKRLERSRDDRMLAGVCGGLARYFGIHPAFYRVGFVVLTLIGGAGILIYAAAALVIPDQGKQDSIASAALRERRDRPWPLIGMGLVAVAGIVLLSRARLWPHGDAAWVLLLLAGIVILQLTRHHPSERRDDGPFPEGGAEVLPEGAAEAPTRVLAARDSRRIGRLVRALAITFGALFALVLIAAAIFTAVFPVHLGRGIGDHTYHVSDLGDLHESYSLGVGDLRVDLSDVQLPVGETQLKTRVDVGRVTVLVPANAAVRVHADARWGEVNLFGDSSEGRDTDRSVIEPGKRILVLDSHVGAGKVVVARAVR